MLVETTSAGFSEDQFTGLHWDRFGDDRRIQAVERSAVKSMGAFARKKG